jgi:glycosyltransferase involved in cell wall biosynthesis
MIVKNEERNLPECLASVADLVHETIVVDTGLLDATRELAAERGARVFEMPWIDSFAAARNESLRHARCPWVFWMDADDRLEEKQRGQVHFLAREAAWPIAVPTRWTKAINCPQTPGEWDDVCRPLPRGAPYASEPWQKQTAVALGLQSSLRPHVRPQQTKDNAVEMK